MTMLRRGQAGGVRGEVRARRTPALEARMGSSRGVWRWTAHGLGLLVCLMVGVPQSSALAWQNELPAGFTIEGRVVDQAGFPIDGAVVSMQGPSTGQVRTGRDGRFRFDGVHTGDAELGIRRLGFQPLSLGVQVTGERMADLEVRLEPLAQQLAPVRVFERREVYDERLAGYHSRLAARGSGYFITRERMDRSTNWTLPDLLREIPGVRIAPINGINKAVRIRGSQCAPLVFVDGFPASVGEFDLEMLPLASLEGVEIYPSLASLPAEFGAARGLERCGVIAAWSRPANQPKGRAASPARIDVEALVASGAVYTADQVQRAARLDTATSPAIAYPDSLWRAGQGGRVLVELVVGADGEVEQGSVRVISATHPAFAEAASDALAGSFFSPGVRGNRTVRQLVQVPVVFAPMALPGAPPSSGGSGPLP